MSDIKLHEKKRKKNIEEKKTPHELQLFRKSQQPALHHEVLL